MTRPSAARQCRLWLLLATMSACAAGVPPGFSEGTNWTIPVVGALDAGPLVAPVFINGEGPFLFALNPRAASTIDPQLAKNLDLYVRRTGRRIVSAQDRISHEKIDMAEILQLRIGTLTVSKTEFIALPAESGYHGQRVWGTIGFQVFAESLIWTIDRDRQVVHLATQGHQRPPAGAIRIAAERIRRNKFFIHAVLNGAAPAYLYIEPCSLGTGVWPRVAQRAALAKQGGRWEAASVRVGRAVVDRVPFYRYRDARVSRNEWDGVLGMEFFANYHLTINWHEQTVWLVERLRDLNDALDERLARWGPSVGECGLGGCAAGSIRVEADTTTLSFERDATLSNARLEALFEAVDATGRPLRLPRLIVAFPESSSTAAIRGKALNMYAHAAGLRLIDVTPFPPPCKAPGNLGCVYVEN